MKTCPFFGKCGGCAIDRADNDYRLEKVRFLDGIEPDETVWTTDGRRRAEFAFLGGKIGFFQRGSNDIVPIENCPLLDDDINNVLREIRKLSLVSGGSVLVTKCDDGIAADFNAPTSFYPSELKTFAAGGVSWNGKNVRPGRPTVFGREFRPNGFLQPTIEGENHLRIFAAMHAAGKVLDLYSGIGTLTVGMDADGFDSFDSGWCRVRNLSQNPVTAKELERYDSIVLDPPRGGAPGQIKEIAKSGRPLVYISCNPKTWLWDKKMLEDTGYKCEHVIAIDQFVGTEHWELATSFRKQ